MELWGMEGEMEWNSGGSVRGNGWDRMEVGWHGRGME
jgi:hypothetical protein